MKVVESKSFVEDIKYSSLSPNRIDFGEANGWWDKIKPYAENELLKCQEICFIDTRFSRGQDLSSYLLDLIGDSLLKGIDKENGNCLYAIKIKDDAVIGIDILLCEVNHKDNFDLTSEQYNGIIRIIQ